jgi:hypothetical protein
MDSGSAIHSRTRREHLYQTWEASSDASSLLSLPRFRLSVSQFSQISNVQVEQARGVHGRTVSQMTENFFRGR